MTVTVYSALLAALPGPAAAGDPDLNTGTGYWAAFTHDFPGSSLDTAVWTPYGAAPTVTANTVRVPVTAYSGINSISQLDITDSSVYFKMDLAGAGGNNPQGYAQLIPGGLDDRTFYVYVIKNTATYEIGTGGNANPLNVFATGAYNATTMAWWRMKHRTARNQLIVDVSPDGQTWTELGAGPLSPGYALTGNGLQFATADNATGYVAYSKANL